MARPASYPTWATSGTRTAPNPTQQASGWVTDDVPPAELFNWQQGLNGDWIEQIVDELDTIVYPGLDLLEVENIRRDLTWENQAASSLHPLFSQTSVFLRDATAKFNSGGSLAGMLFVGDSGTLYSRVLNGAFTLRTAGSGSTNSFAACCTCTNGNYVVAGSRLEIQISSDGITFTRTNGTNTPGDPPFYWVDTDGVNCLAGGQNGALYFSADSGATWSVRTSPAGGADSIMSGMWTGSVWVIFTFDGEIWTTASTTAANGSWTQRLTLTGSGSPAFRQNVCRKSALGYMALYVSTAGTLVGKCYSSDGISWTQQAANNSFGDDANCNLVMLPNSWVMTDNPNAGTEYLSTHSFTNLTDLASANGTCRTTYGVLQADCRMFNVKTINDQIIVLCHDGTNSFVYQSMPYKRLT